LLVDLPNHKLIAGKLSFQNIIQPAADSLRESTIWYPESLPASRGMFSPAQAVSDSIQSTFIQQSANGSSPIEIVPRVRMLFPYEWMLELVLLLLVVMVVLWFVMPGKRSFYQQFRHFFHKPLEMAAQTPGFLFSAFYYLNYLVIVVLFTILATGQFIRADSLSISSAQLIWLIALAFVAYSLYKLLYIALAGFLFKTQANAKQQLRLYINLDILTGFILLPFMLLILLSPRPLLFYFGIFIFLIANAIKWFQTIAIRKSIVQYKLYHLIIYLCTLEIIPVLLLLKLVENLSS
jgi:hypothetical protein